MKIIKKIGGIDPGLLSQVSVTLWSWLQHITAQTLSLHLSFSDPNWMTPGFLLLCFQMVLFGRKKYKRWPVRNDLVGVIVCDVDWLSLSSTHFAFSGGQPSRDIRFQELSWERDVPEEPVLAASARSTAKATLPSSRSRPQAGFGCVQREERPACSWKPGPGVRGHSWGWPPHAGVSLLQGWPRVLRCHPGQFSDGDLVSRTVDGIYSGVMGIPLYLLLSLASLALAQGFNILAEAPLGI